MKILLNYIVGVKQGVHYKSFARFLVAIVLLGLGVFGVVVGAGAFRGTYTTTERSIDLWLGRALIATALILFSAGLYALVDELEQRDRKDKKQIDPLWLNSHAERVGAFKKGP